MGGAIMKVLIVDDEPLARSRLRRMLENMADNDVVGEAENGEQALAAAQRWQPQVVLMDVRMPGLDGLSAAQELSRWPAAQSRRRRRRLLRDRTPRLR